MRIHTRTLPARLHPAWRALALGLAYAAIFKLITVETSFGTSVGSTFWPASGVTVAVLVRSPRRYWPLYLLAIWLADGVMDVTTAGFPLLQSIGLAASNAAEPLLGATLVTRWLPDGCDLWRLRALGRFYAGAAAAGPLLGASLATVWTWALGYGGPWPFGGRWFLGDALGVVIIAPLVIGARSVGARTPDRRTELVATAGVMAFAAVALPWSFASQTGLPFLVIPALSLIGILAGSGSAARAVFIVAAAVEALTAVGVGPFAGAGSFTGLLAAQTYLAACSASGLTAAALMEELLGRDRMARHDHLTGLANRRALMERITAAHDPRTQRAGAIGLVYIDLDGFKRINDHHGHAFGDHVLEETARRLRGVTREHDTIARIGGDEFVILVEQLSERGPLAILARRAAEVVGEPIAHRGVTVDVGASIGHVTGDRLGETRDELLARADAAMYASKRARGARPREESALV